MSSPKIAIIIYSMYGHIAKMAESVKKGIESAGGSATILQVPETLPKEVLQKMNAPPKPEYPLVTAADLPQYDGFIFGISTRYGNWSGQFKAFWDSTGQIWVSGALAGKFASVFVSSAGPGGGQESTYFSVLTTLVHHGLVFVPLGYKYTSALWNTHFEEVHGGSPFGAGTFAKVDGSRQPSEVELEVASIQGREFYNMLQRYVSKSSAAKGALNEEAHNATAVESKKGATAAHEGEASSSTEKSKQKRRSVLGKIINRLK